MDKQSQSIQQQSSSSIRQQETRTMKSSSSSSSSVQQSSSSSVQQIVGQQSHSFTYSGAQQQQVQQQRIVQQSQTAGLTQVQQQAPTFTSNDDAALYYSQQQHRIQQQVQQQLQAQSVQPAAPPILVQQNNQTMLIPNISAHPPSPPVFQEVFRNSRFALGQNAVFEGRISGWPKPTLTSLRKDLPLPSSEKHFLRYDENTGRIVLQINQIGPVDVGEYTCIARNQFGEAICTVNIQPEMFQQAGARAQAQPLSPTFKSTNVQPQMILYPMSIFKVDTFEYRLLREIEYRQNLTRRYQDDPDVYVISPPSTQPGPPRVLARQRNMKISEGETAQFFVKIEGVNTKVIWFRDGQRLCVDTRLHVTTPDINTICFTLENVQADEAGYYTCFAENPWGCVVSSNQLAVDKRTTTTTSSMEQRTIVSQQATLVQQTEEVTNVAATFTRIPGTTPNQSIEIEEGKLLRLDCRVSRRPAPEVKWFINEVEIVNDNTHKAILNEQGSYSLMITSVSRQDSGGLVCVAKNKSGEARFKLNINVIEKEQIIAPKFVERFSTLSVKEGKPVSLSARAVGNPIPGITWQKDGVAVLPSQAVSVTSQDGWSTIEIPAARLSDSGWYQCMAQNSAGSTATRARLFVEKPVVAQVQDDSNAPWRLNLPKPSKVIEPEKPPSPEVIYLRHVEMRRQQQIRQEEPERSYDPPVFIIPLKDMSVYDGGRAHFEAKIHPVGDPTIRIDWYKDGVALAMSARINTTYRFGFIALDILGLSELDQGVYTCVISSATGSAESSANLVIQAREQIYTDTSSYARSETSHVSSYQELVSEPQVAPPQFIKQLNSITASEGRTAHFEAQVSSQIDKVEWYFNNRVLTASSRITTISNFGYLSLNIMHLRNEDAGTYVVKVWNKSGEAVSTPQLVVQAGQTAKQLEENTYIYL